MRPHGTVHSQDDTLGSHIRVAATQCGALALGTVWGGCLVGVGGEYVMVMRGGGDHGGAAAVWWAGTGSSRPHIVRWVSSGALGAVPISPPPDPFCPDPAGT
jgi:hypothetical protein